MSSIKNHLEDVEEQERLTKEPQHPSEMCEHDWDGSECSECGLKMHEGINEDNPNEDR